MMFLLRSKLNLMLQTQTVSREVVRALFSTANFISSDSLDRRIWVTKDPTASVIPVIEKWIQEGNEVDGAKLFKSIKQLRKQRRFSHALQISEWLGEKSGRDADSGYLAIRLDLISKVNGLTEAENYFKSVPDRARGYQVYGALLNCYAHHKYLEKAEALMQKMRELGLMQTLAYNVMLNLYCETGKLERLDGLMQEMEEKGIPFDIYTYNTRLKSYVTTSNIEGMEKLLLRMELDPLITMDWNAYVIAATGFLKSSQVDKAVAMIKKSEALIRGNSCFAYENLLTLYATAGDKDGVYRVWNIYKNRGRFSSLGYLCMITSLMKLGDLDGVEMIWEEWLSVTKAYDIRIPSAMISAYSRKGLWEKAEAIVSKISERGIEPNPSSWDHLATGYCIGGQMVKAAETLKKAILSSKRGWKPNLNTLTACLKYLESKGDVKEKEELSKMVQEHSRFSATTFHKLTSGNLSIKPYDQVGSEQKAVE